jgi:hypothetical protein
MEGRDGDTTGRENSDQPNNAQKDIAILAKGVGCLFVVSIALALLFPSSKPMPGFYRVLTDTIGFAYTACWSYSFYPQVFLNYKRRCAPRDCAQLCVSTETRSSHSSASFHPPSQA